MKSRRGADQTYAQKSAGQNPPQLYSLPRATVQMVGRLAEFCGLPKSQVVRAAVAVLFLAAAERPEHERAEWIRSFAQPR